MSLDFPATLRSHLLEDLFQRVRMPPADRPKVACQHAMFQLMTMLAAPRLLAGDLVSDEVIVWMQEGLWRRIFDQYLGMLSRIWRGVEKDTDDLFRTERAARQVRALLASWPFARTAPEALVQAARDFFRAFGWAEQKWDEVDTPLTRGMDPALLAKVESAAARAAAMDESEYSGAVFPCIGSERLLLVMAATQRAYLPCFTTEAKLRELMQLLDLPVDRMERIEDGRAFMDSLPAATGEQVFRLILDPQLDSSGMRWVEFKRDFALEPDSAHLCLLALPGASVVSGGL